MSAPPEETSESRQTGLAAPFIDEASYPVSVGAWYGVLVLLLMYMMSLADRQVISLMVVPLQRDLGISDVQFSLLQGLAFVMFYLVAGLFIGWAVDRWNRRLLIMIGVMFWSISCAVCGLANGFWMLFVARVGVGVGEAVLYPGAVSLLADMFPPRKRTLAMGVFSTGATVGVAISFALGGVVMSLLAHSGSLAVPLLGALEPWQATFLILGLPGLPIALLALTMKDPPRRGVHSTGKFLSPVVALYRARPRVFICHTLAFSLNLVIGYSLIAWTPAYLTRHFGWEGGAIGVAFGLALAVGGLTGPIISGAVADWFFRRGVFDIQFRLTAIYMAAAVPMTVAMFMASSPWLFLSGVGGIYFISAAASPLCSAALQIVSPAELRGRTSAVYGFVSTLLGLGIGPVLVAAITEHVLHDHGAVGTSIAIVVAGSAFCSMLLMLLGLRAYRSAVVEGDPSLQHEPALA
jgi:MFS family permease